MENIGYTASKCKWQVLWRSRSGWCRNYLRPGAGAEITGIFLNSVFRIRIRIKKCHLDPDPHGQMRIRIQEVKKPRKRTGSFMNIELEE